MTGASGTAAAGEDSAPTGPPGMPRWVKVGGIVIGILVLIFVVLHLAGRTPAHGANRHVSAGVDVVHASRLGPGPPAARQ